MASVSIPFRDRVLHTQEGLLHRVIAAAHLVAKSPDAPPVAQAIVDSWVSQWAIDAPGCLQLHLDELTETYGVESIDTLLVGVADWLSGASPTVTAELCRQVNPGSVQIQFFPIETERVLGVVRDLRTLLSGPLVTTT